MAKYYAVKKGQHPGIYTNWPDAQKEVSGFSGAVYKSFKTQAEAQAFIDGSTGELADHAPAGMVIGYTDGGTRNTGNVKGGHVQATDAAAWAYRLELPDGVLSGSDGEWGATNNRMEILALIKALETLLDHHQQRADITLVLDSKYVLDAINKGWLKGWQRRGWQRSSGPLINAELWRQVYQLLPHFPKLSLVWTKGHAENQGNIFVDSLLNKTMDDMEKAGRPAGKAVPKTSLPSKRRTSNTSGAEPKKNYPKQVPEIKEYHGKVQSKEVAKSVDDIQKALEQLDLFKDQ
ncbi:ribonuclease H family protein [Secundilactobacillus folii]|uniref:Ribonuclease H n=1 Tax=Secundilactobacillus folii TaxID=2678357 RepID=A0A7X3C2P8_9LACO|nr:ribonuclease H family protein [Secundilactobacillus folii]MTV83085.1 ribonuclease [Secundilactobacillus folii]